MKKLILILFLSSVVQATYLFTDQDPNKTTLDLGDSSHIWRCLYVRYIYDYNDIRFYNPAGTYYASFKAPALTANKSWTWWIADGNSGDVAYTTGSGVLSWKSISYSETDPCWAAWLAGPPNISIFTNDSGYLTSYTETDPCLSVHLTSFDHNDIADGETAYGWGDHAGLYLDIDHDACDVTTAKIANWDDTATDLDANDANWDASYVLKTTLDAINGYIRGNGGGVYWADANAYSLSTHNHSGTYQPLDGQLEDIAGLGLAKGSILVGSATHWQLLAVGNDDEVLTADSGEPNGVKWAAGGGDMTKTVYDVIGDNFVDGNDTVYAASWNGNINAPSMNAAYDKMQTFLTTVDISANTNLVAGTNCTMVDDTLNVDDPMTLSSLVINDDGTIGQAAGPLLTFDDTANKLSLSGGLFSGASTVTATALVQNQNVLTVDTTGGDIAWGIGIWGETDVTGGNDITTFIRGVYGKSKHIGTGTVADARGVQGAITCEAAGVITNAYTLSALGPVTSGGGAITTAYGLYISVHKAAGVTTGYGVYQVGADDLNYFAGASDFGAAPSLEIPNSAAPTVDAEGELAWESDDDDLHIYTGAVDAVIASKTKSRSFVIKGITTADDFAFWQTPRALIITKVAAICSSGTNVVGQLQEYSGTATAPADVNTVDWTITTSEYERTSFSNGTIDAGDWIGFKTTSVSGTVNYFSLSFEYYEQ